jgi:Tfp pilus assembly protein PilZ
MISLGPGSKPTAERPFRLAAAAAQLSMAAVFLLPIRSTPDRCAVKPTTGTCEIVSKVKPPASIRDQIVRLVDRMPADMQLKLLRFLEAKLPRRIKGNLVLEKRSDLRKTCLISVDYTIGDRRFSGFILDISAFGVFIESDDPLPIGREIRLEFTLPGYGRSLHLEGSVVWSGTQGIGVKFRTLTREQVTWIKRFSEEKSQVYTIIS